MTSPRCRAAVLEDEIRRTEASVVPEVLLADAELPGVDDDAMSLREALRLGGARTITILGLLGALQLMDGGVFNVLAPDIQKSFGVSDAVLGAIGARPACCSSSARSRCRRCRTARHASA